MLYSFYLSLFHVGLKKDQNRRLTVFGEGREPDKTDGSGGAERMALGRLSVNRYEPSWFAIPVA